MKRKPADTHVEAIRLRLIIQQLESAHRTEETQKIIVRLRKDLQKIRPHDPMFLD